MSARRSYGEIARQLTGLRHLVTRGFSGATITLPSIVMLPALETLLLAARCGDTLDLSVLRLASRLTGLELRRFSQVHRQAQ